MQNKKNVQGERQWNANAKPAGEIPDVPADPRASNDMIKLIRKLRWVGMESEAERLRSSLAGMPQLDSVVAEPRETD
jgi:hypothetical protein